MKRAANSPDRGNRFEARLRDRGGQVFNIQAFQRRDQKDWTRALLDAANEASFGGGTIFFPPREYLVPDLVTLLGMTGITLAGAGWMSVIRTTGENIPIKVQAGTRWRVQDLRFTGSGQATTSSEGIGLHIINSDDVKVHHCWFDGWGFRGLQVESSSGEHGGVTIEDCIFTNQIGNVGFTTASDIAIRGSLRDVVIRNTRHTAHASTPTDYGIFVMNNGTSLAWSDVLVDRANVRPAPGQLTGYKRFGVGGTDENPDGSFRVGIMQVTDCRIFSCVQEGIKFKNLHRAIATGNYIEDCNHIPEGVSLRGAIFLNGTQECIVAHNEIVGDHTDGIRMEGQAAFADGQGRNRWVIGPNIIRDCADAGISVQQYVYDVDIHPGLISGCGNGIRFQGQAATDAQHVKRATITGGQIRGCTSQGITSNASPIDELIITGTRCIENGLNGVIVTLARNITLSGVQCIDNSQASANVSDGIVINSSVNVQVIGCRSGNTGATGQRYGIRFASNTTEQIVGCNTTNNQTAGLNGTAGATVAGNI